MKTGQDLLNMFPACLGILNLCSHWSTQKEGNWTVLLFKLKSICVLRFGRASLLYLHHGLNFRGLYDLYISDRQK